MCYFFRCLKKSTWKCNRRGNFHSNKNMACSCKGTYDKRDTTKC